MQSQTCLNCAKVYAVFHKSPEPIFFAIKHFSHTGRLPPE